MKHPFWNVLVLGVVLLLGCLAFWGGTPSAQVLGAPGQVAGVLGKPANVAFANSDLKQGIITGKSIIFGDRKEYWADDETGQFLIALLPPGEPAKPQAGAKPAETAKPASPVAAQEAGEQVETGRQNGLEAVGVSVPSVPAAAEAKPIAAKMVAVLSRISGTNATQLEKVEAGSPAFQKFHLRMDSKALTAGDYRLTAWLEDAAGAKGPEAQWDFKKTDKKSDAPAFPADGLPITLETLTDTRTMGVPVTLAIPLPKGAVAEAGELAIVRNGKEVDFQIQVQARWGPGASVRWAQATFVAQYQGGTAAGYRLVKRGKETGKAPEPKVKVQESPTEITVDNGTLRFTVSKKSFAGIQQAWFDASGKGSYDMKMPVISARGDESGPFMMDERLVKFTSAADKTPTVKVESAGPQQVTLVASGWYADRANRVPPMCQYQVRMTLSAGESQVVVAHNTVITFDSRKHKIRDLGFAINYTGAKRYAFGVDGAGISGMLSQAAGVVPKRAGEQTVYPAVFMHQKTWDLCTVTREDGKRVDGKKSDGWVATWIDEEPAICVTLRDVWEKFPKELEARNEAIVVHAWPKNGKRVFTPEQELALKNIYKFWCFHQHIMLDLNLPQDYYEVLASLDGTETRETKAEHALNGNAQGMTIGTNMSIRVYPGTMAGDDKGERFAAQCLKDARLFEARPYATLSPQWCARSQALEPISETNGDFKAFEETILNGLAAYNGTVERGQAYGMFIWPDTHTYWLPAEGRASLHRTWQNSHYHQVGNAWVLWLRSGDARMLRWARDNSAHFRDVGTIAYAEPGSAETAIQFHLPGAMYHCKGCTPWGSETKGMIRRDTHAGLWGHWVDPDAHLYAWLMDGDARGHDMYALWLSSLKTYGFLGTGVRREANNTLAMIIHAYEFTGDPDFLPAIWTLGLSLRTKEPLEAQNPGPMWHPLWINRYYHLTRDPEYVPFILKYGRSAAMGNTWNLALSALAYEVSGDKTYLTQQLQSIKMFPRELYRCPGDPYDNYGMGPGPLGMNWGEMGVGSYMRAVKQAGISTFPTDLAEPAGQYPVALGRKAYSEFWGLSKAGGEIKINASAAGIEGDAHKGEMVVTGADGQVLARSPEGQANRIVMTADVKVAPGSLVNVAYQGYGGISSGVKGFDAQAGLLASGRGYGMARAYFYMAPLQGKPEVATLKFDSPPVDGNDRAKLSVIVTDGAGAVVLDASLHNLFQSKTASIALDPAKNPLPWRVDTIGAARFSVTSPTAMWIIAPTKADMETMKPLILKLPSVEKAQAK
jgi:hypothetical protein